MTTQTKPPRRMTYKDKARAGLLERKPRKTLPKVSHRNASRMSRYRAWIKIAMYGLHRCNKCRVPGKALEPHHPYGRSGENLFKVVEVCTDCHADIHRFPNLAYSQGWIQPELKGRVRQPDHPQPFTLLPAP